MRRQIQGIDHCVVLVRDLDTARASYARLGFTLSPRGLHSAHMGSGNHTIMFGTDYFELLGIVTPTEHNRSWRERLAGGEGLSGIALKTGDAAAAAAELRGAGIAVSDPVHFSRPVERADGTRSAAAFNTIQLPADATPDTRMFACQHLTPENTWLPELQHHANTATGLAAVIVAVADPQHAAHAYARLFDSHAVPIGPGAVAVDTGNTPLQFLTGAALRERYRGLDLAALTLPLIAGLVITVADRDTVRACLRDAGIAGAETAIGIAVPPAAAHGAVLEFTVADH